MIDKTETLGSQVREIETQFISGNGTQTSKYVNSDLYEDISKIYAYLESKHITGEYDSQGREKPFFNIVIAARNIRYRATDIDRKNIKIKATKSSDVFADFMATILLQDWMRRQNFGYFLNVWGMELAGFNDSVCKFVEKSGELIPSVVPWSRLIVDKLNFKKNLKIELLEMTEAQMYDSGYDSKVIESLSERARELTSKQKQDNKNNYFKLYEVHGVLPLSYITDKDSDADTYVQQMHVLSFLYNKKDKSYEEFALYRGREEKDPYLLTTLMPTADGSISLQGAVKDLFDPQWMVNHTKKQIKDQLDLASKLIFQTSDGNFVGQNALNAIESGDILIHQNNMPLTQLQNNSHDISSLQNYGNEWKSLGNEIAGISESMLGNAAPSGTAWRQVEALLNESHSLFELMTENKGLALEEMLTTFIIPFLKKKMDNEDEIAAMLSDYGISQIEAKYVKNETIKRSNDSIVAQWRKGEVPVAPDPAAVENQIKDQLSDQGAQRFLKPSEIAGKTWKDVLADLEWELEIDITGEQKDNQADMATLSTVFQTVVGLNGQPMSPEAKVIFEKILMRTGTVSPLEISTMNAAPKPPATVAPPEQVDTGMAKKPLATNTQ